MTWRWPRRSSASARKVASGPKPAVRSPRMSTVRLYPDSLSSPGFALAQDFGRFTERYDFTARERENEESGAEQQHGRGLGGGNTEIAIVRGEIRNLRVV